MHSPTFTLAQMLQLSAWEPLVGPAGGPDFTLGRPHNFSGGALTASGLAVAGLGAGAAAGGGSGGAALGAALLSPGAPVPDGLAAGSGPRAPPGWAGG